MKIADDAFQQLASATAGIDPLRRAIDIGKVVVELIFEGDAEALASRSPKSPSVREVAAHERVKALGITRRTLADYARVYLQSLRLPDHLGDLTLAQRLALLTLPEDAQDELGRVALEGALSVRDLRAEVDRHPDRPPRTRSQKARMKSRSRARTIISASRNIDLAALTDQGLKDLEDRLSALLVKVRDEARGRGLTSSMPTSNPVAVPSSRPVATPVVRHRYSDGPLSSGYRPRGFDEVVGNRDVVENLHQLAVNRSMVPLLLHGCPGTGKTTLGLLYLRAWLCESEDRTVSAPCGQCESCLRCVRPSLAAFQGGIGTVAAASTGDARAAAQVVLDELMSPWDALIVNEADRLLIQQQRLLNRLEGDLAFPLVFTTTDLKKLDDQFVSRCVPVQVEPIGRADMVRLLAEVAVAESVVVSENELEQLLDGLGNTRAGQARDALNALEGLLHRADGASNS